MRRLAILLVLAAGLLAPPQAFAQISLLGLQNSMVQFLLRQISVEGEFEITARGVEENEDGNTQLSEVAIADGDGVWFRADAIVLRWNARRILSAELEVNELTIRGMEVLRRPTPPEVTVNEDAEIAGEGFDPFAWPRVPITTRVELMRLENAFVAAGVIGGQSLGFEAEGAFADEGDIQSLRLVVSRTDEVEGRIDLDYVRDFSDESLKLDLAAEEAAGGLVAELAGLPAESASRVRFDASGPLVDWQATLSAEAERVVAVSGDLQVDAAAPVSAAAQLSIRPGPELDPGAAAALGDEARLDFAMTEEDGLIRIERGSFVSPAVGLEASGSYSRPDGAMDFDLSLEVRRALAEAIEGVDFETAGFTGRVSGTPEALEARGELSLSELSTGPADVGSASLETVAGRNGDVISVDVNGLAQRLRLDRIGPETLGEARLTVDAEYDLAAARGTLSTFGFDSRPLQLSVQGEVDVAADRADVDYEVSAPELGAIASAYDVDADGAFAASGRLDGALSAPRLTGRATLGSLTFEGRSWGRVTLDHDVTAGEPLTGSADIAAEDGPYGPATASARFRLDGDLLTLETLTAEALEMRVEGALTADLAGPTAEGRVTVQAPRLAALSDLAGAPLGGSASLDATLSAPDGRQDATVALEATDLTGFDASLANLSLAVTARDLAGAPDAEWQLRAERVGAAGATVETLRSAGTARDLLGAPSVEATAEALGLAAPEQDASVERVDLTLSAADLTGAPRANVEILAEGLRAADAAVARATLEAEGEDLLAAPRGRATLRAESIAAGGATVEVATLEAEGEDLLEAPRGRATLRAETIAAGGAAIAAAVLEAEGENLIEAPAARGTLTVDAVSAGEAGVRRITAEFDGRDLIEAPAGALNLVAESVRLSPDARMGRVTLKADGSAEALSLSLNGEGTLDDAPGVERGESGPLRVALEGSGALVGEGATFAFTRLDARAGEARARLARPLTIRREGTSTLLRGMDLRIPGGALTGDAAVHDDGLTTNLRLDLADLVPIAELAEAPVAGGSLTLRARSDTRPGSPSALIRLEANDLMIEGVPPEAGTVGLTSNLRWDGATLEGSARLAGQFGEPARVSMRLPLRPAGLLPAPPPGAEIGARVQWTGDVARLWALAPAPDHVLAGQLDIDMRLQGPLANPVPRGRLELTGGAYQNLETGTILTDIEARTRLREDGGLRVRVDAEDGAGGPVNAEIDLDGAELSARLTTRSAVLVRRDDVTAAITANIRAQGPVTAPAITGEVRIDRAEVRLIVTGAPSVPDLGTVEIKGEPVPEPEPPSEGGPTLDLRIHAPSDIYVRGRGLDSEWEMDLSVTGPAGAPRVNGAIEKRRGYLDFVGRDFDLARGAITFAGRNPIDPALDVALEHEREGLLGRIAVRGYASEPEIVFESVPSLPEDEVLPRTLFGQSRQSLTAGQALQLAAGVATLLSGSEGFLGGVRSAVGLDVLSVDLGEGEDAASVRLGRNIADGVFVGVRQPIDGGSAAVQVEVEVMDNITVDSETGSDDGTSIGLNWRMDF